MGKHIKWKNVKDTICEQLLQPDQELNCLLHYMLTNSDGSDQPADRNHHCLHKSTCEFAMLGLC